MSSSTNLILPLLQSAQAQKHVTVNECAQKLDLVVQLSVLDRDLSAPPGAPVDGARYVVAASPSGAWSGQAGKIAAWQDGVWSFLTPREGWIAWVADENRLLVHDGTSWIENFGNLTVSTLTATKVSAAPSAYLVLESVKATTGDPTGQEGMLVINSVDNVIRLYADGAWRTLASW